MTSASAGPGELRRAGIDLGFADDAISAGRLGEIEPPVGAFEHAVVIGRVVSAGRKPDADGDERGGSLGIHVAGDVAADPLAERQGRGPRQTRRDDDKFLAAITEHGIVGADCRHHDARDAQQHHVAGGMAETVIEALEVIDVDNEKTRRLSGQHCLLDVLAAQMFQTAAIERAGQRVAARSCH